RIPKYSYGFRNHRGVKDIDAHAHDVVDIVPWVWVDHIAVSIALFGLRLQRGPSLNPRGDTVENYAGVIEEVFDGITKIARGTRMHAYPFVVLIAQFRDG